MKRVRAPGKVHSRIGKLAPRDQVQVVRDCMEGCRTISRPEPGEHIPVNGRHTLQDGIKGHCLTPPQSLKEDQLSVVEVIEGLIKGGEDLKR
jgi:hypothetical protein